MEPAANATPQSVAAQPGAFRSTGDDSRRSTMAMPWKAGGQWSTEHTTGALALGALAFLVVVRIAFRGALGD